MATLQPPTHIADEFQHYIHNHIPARLIDTSKLTFVERSDVFDVFSTEIAQITEEDVQRRVDATGVDTHPEAGIYVSARKAALRETVRDVVRYAIFSHRWTDNEPSHHDISTTVSPGGLSKKRNIKTAGLAKLVQLCETARALGYKLVWSDTCCIDKTNPAELSEAIHAMFKWYAHAHLCIVHLAASLSLADFEHEPWFKRGWTLQELLAPRRIKFYDQGWRPFTNLVNDKDDQGLMFALSAVTGIPRDVVIADNSRGIKGCGVWEIMSWASTRKTTRIEDAAYCLYGLFDVHPSIAYGEGERAFARLVKEIVERYHTWDVFVWGGEASQMHSALPCSPACYPRWDEAMVGGGLGMTDFTLTAHGLRLTSVPLIPLAFASDEKDESGSYTVMLSPRSDAVTALGVYGDITVVCGSGRLQHIRRATDLHACILNYKPSQRSHRGELQVGRTYVCFLLYMEGRNAEGSTWLKVATDNVLQIPCKGVPAKRSFEMEDGGFDLSLADDVRTGPSSSIYTCGVMLMFFCPSFYLSITRPN
ncbi:hypothetical protein JVT61DRAFT_618 [Boletus reticuloceps]|uniref:Heterokaryon incompatibility domain-containing protein n=1 Tax=Boletus reticuloceps TaxID=495285 RepID=A0A8I2Z345_9AGAM|nr:hypothetical protein JVT61DRAFT_618 [Boletus reticuloceps]